MADLKQICDRIRELGNQQETPELRAEVETAFTSKWEGVQVVAVRVLGHWGGRRSVELIKEWLLNYYKNHGRGGRGLEKAASEALSECFAAQDVTWILDVYFNEPKMFYFRGIIVDIPVEMTQERVINELKHPEPFHRHHAIIAALDMKILAACPAIKKLRYDPDASVRFAVRELSKTLCP